MHVDGRVSSDDVGNRQWGKRMLYDECPYGGRDGFGQPPLASTFSRLQCLLVVAVMAAMASCNCGKKTAEEEQSAELEANEGGGEAAYPPAGYAPYVALDDVLHLADVYHQGLYIDFGTPARAKYTHGNWKSGWGTDKRFKSRSVSHVGSTGRLYFPLGKVEPVTLRLRLRPVGTQTLTLFVNGRSLPVMRLDKGEAFADYDMPVPADHLVKGENYLLMRFGGTTRLAGEDVSVAFESLRVIPGMEQENSSFEPPTFFETKSDIALGDAKALKALKMPADSRLAWQVEVPKGGMLYVRIGAEQSTPTRIIATTVEGEKKTLLSAQATKEWKAHRLSLAEWEGELVQIELVAEGKTGTVYWAKPTVFFAQSEKEKQPDFKQAKNVVLLLVDTLRADKLTAINPKTRVKTPAVDALASDGVTFTAAQSPENWTKPSVASVLTSLYPMTHCAKTFPAKLSDKATMLSEIYKKAGFATGSFIANGYVSDKFGFDQGWDHYTNYIRESKSTEAENVFGEAASWIEKNKGSRFFAYIQTIDPHVPYDPPDPYLQMYDKQEYNGPVESRLTAKIQEKASASTTYLSGRDKARLETLHDGEISYHDEHLRQFVAKLKELGLYEDTVFIMTSDHGEEFNEHGRYGHGHSVYQELLNVPFIIRYPAAVPKGKRYDMTVSTLDIGPTLLALSGIDIPSTFEGRNLLPTLSTGTPAFPAVAFSDFLDNWRVVRAGRWKLVLQGARSMFYDLKNDPLEKTDISGKKATLAKRYTRALLGQFLAARQRGRWWRADQGKGSNVKAEETELDATTRKQLEGLGYIIEDQVSDCFGEGSE